jgi:mannose-6-phosphate isomerase
MIKYPIRFESILKEKIWGGNKLTEILKKKSDESSLGESWEISGVKNDISVAANGPLKGKTLKTIIELYKEQFLGKNNYERFGPEFPLLIKFIDAKSDLSVQLHPHDNIAKKRHNSLGKTEMWYILQAEKGAEINVGFKRGISKGEYLEYLNSKKITELLNFEKVNEGDSFFIHTGEVHAIGAGVLLAEIQQTSDITYRIYDWDRVDSEGNPRELHTDLALDAIDFKKKNDFRRQFSRLENQSNNIASCEYFNTNFLPIKGKLLKDYSKLDSFVIFMCVKGHAEVKVGAYSEEIAIGQTLLIPAAVDNVEIISEGTDLLEIFVI